MRSDKKSRRLGRRAFLQNGTLLLAAAGTVDAASLFAAEDGERLRVGLVTDLHHADKSATGTRHYRETLGKLEEAALQFAKDKPAFIVELGDLIDAADSVETEQRYLQTINREFAAISQDLRGVRQGAGRLPRAQPPERPEGHRRHPLLHVGGDGRRLRGREQRVFGDGHRLGRLDSTHGIPQAEGLRLEVREMARKKTAKRK